MHPGMHARGRDALWPADEQRGRCLIPENFVPLTAGKAVSAFPLVTTRTQHLELSGLSNTAFV